MIVTARVTGEAYGAFYTPEGVPYEEVVPFELDISNSASGVVCAADRVRPAGRRTWRQSVGDDAGRPDGRRRR